MILKLQEAKEKLMNLVKRHEDAINDLRALLTQLTDLQREEVEKLDLSKLSPDERLQLGGLCEKMGLTRTKDATAS